MEVHHTNRPGERHVGPQLPYSQELHAKKYRGEGETFRDYANRVATALKDDDRHWKVFREALIEQMFLPAGRVQAAIGSTKNVTAYNCFVSGVIEDSFVHGSGSIMDRAKEAATTMRMGGGIGYDFSTLRPRGAMIRKLQSQSSGPLAFMDVYDAVGRATASSGHRRGAQMGVLRVDHPDIEEFIRAKNNETRLRGFNLSIGATEEFMQAVMFGRSFDLRWGGQVYKTVEAQALWELIMRSTWDWAEPGVLFLDTINHYNNLYYCERIAATNPCGEQPLPPYGACLLGSLNLVKFVKKDAQGSTWFDYKTLEEIIPAVVRAMDNVVDRTTYPLHEQEQEARSKRRMGLGVTGLANAGEALGNPYGSPNFCRFEDTVLRTLRDHAYVASACLAAEKGSFPLFDRDRFMAGKYVSRLPHEVRELMKLHGIRNSHLTSIAPTGTISMAADNVSSGLEPVFAHEVKRTVIEFAGEREDILSDYGYRVLGVKGKVQADVTVQEHIDVLLTAAPLVDSAISKTCNVPSTTSWEDFKDIYMQAWKGGAKGCTTYTVGGRRGGVIEAVAPEGQTCSIVNGVKSCE
jgi:ribonucleoside-diphosphate reductase alpha chain